MPEGDAGAACKIAKHDEGSFPVPVSSRLPLPALVGIERVPDKAPAVRGEKVADTKHVAPISNDVPQVVEALKGGVAEGVPIDRLAVPVLLTVTEIAEDVFPVDVSGKFSGPDDDKA